MNKKPNKVLKSLSFVLFLIAFTGFGYFIGKMGASASVEIPRITVVLIAVLFIPIFFIVVGIHEAGHALAGKWVGFDFRMYIVGPFMWNKEETGWRFQWNKNVNLAGGMVVCMPTDTDDLGRRFSVYAAGGPVASLLLTLLAYGMYWLIAPGDIAGHVATQTLAYFFLVMAFLSLVIFIVTAIPMHFGGFSSDGARVLRLLRGGETARFETLILKLIAGSTSGLRPGLVNMDELNEAHALAIKLNAPFGVYLLSFYYQSAFDRGETEEAERYLLEYIGRADEIPAGLRNAVWLDAAFFYAFAKRDLDTADKYWSQFKPAAMVPKAQILATEAAIAALKNQDQIALDKIESSLHELPNMIDKGFGMALQDKLIQLRGYVQHTARPAIVMTRES